MLNHSWAYRSACRLLHGARVTVLEPKNSMAESKIWIQSSPFAQCNLELGYIGKLAYFSAGMMQLRVRLSDELTCFSSDMMRPSALSRAWYSSSFSMSSVPAFPALASCSCQPVKRDTSTQHNHVKGRRGADQPVNTVLLPRLPVRCWRCVVFLSLVYAVTVVVLYLTHRGTSWLDL